jgi:hypothetical protein
MALPFEEFCPVSEKLLGRLYRSSPEGMAVLVRTVPPNTRAMLAYYCSRRTHLESLGLYIASTCSQEDLYDVAGRAGWDLFARAQAEAVKIAEPPKRKSRQGVTLASGPLWTIPGPEE